MEPNTWKGVLYQSSQQPGEKVYIMYKVKENYGFGDKRDKHICDGLVVGIRDEEVSQKFQLTADFTLAQIIQQVVPLPGGCYLWKGTRFKTLIVTITTLLITVLDEHNT